MRLVLSLLLVLPTVASAAPLTLQHQGRATDASGVPLQGQHTIAFALFASEGAATDLWSESHTLQLADGYYSVTLGDQTLLQSEWFADNDAWFSTTVGSTSFSQRLALHSVPYAIHAAEADSLSGDSLDVGQVQLSAGDVSDGTCDNTLSGSLRYNAGNLYLCNGAGWVRLAASADGSSPADAVSSCLDLHTAQPTIPSSVRWVDFDGTGGAAPVQVFCDMDTRGGGWTVFARVYEENNSQRYGFDTLDNGFSETADTFVSLVGVSFDEMAFIRRDTNESRAVSLSSSTTWPAFGSHQNSGNGYTIAENPDVSGQFIRAHDADSGKTTQLCFLDTHNDECGPTSAGDPGNYGDAGGNDGFNMMWDGSEINAIGTGIVWDFAIR